MAGIDRRRRTLTGEGVYVRWQRMVESHSYGFVLVLIVLTFVWALSCPTQQWARVVLVALQSCTLLAALWTSRAPARLVRWAAAVCR